MYIWPRSRENLLLNTSWPVKIAFWSDSVGQFDASYLNQSLVRLMKRLDVWPRPECYNTNLSTDAHVPTQPAQQAFLCGLGTKNEEQETKTARIMAQVKERGGVGEERKETLFLSFLSPSPSFIFWFSFNFSRDQNRNSPSTVSFCSETKQRNACSAGQFQLCDFPFRGPTVKPC